MTEVLIVSLSNMANVHKIIIHTCIWFNVGHMSVSTAVYTISIRVPSYNDLLLYHRVSNKEYTLLTCMSEWP